MTITPAATAGHPPWLLVRGPRSQDLQSEPPGAAIPIVPPSNRADLSQAIRQTQENLVALQRLAEQTAAAPPPVSRGAGRDAAHVPVAAGAPATAYIGSPGSSAARGQRVRRKPATASEASRPDRRRFRGSTGQPEADDRPPELGQRLGLPFRLPPWQLRPRTGSRPRFCCKSCRRRRDTRWRCSSWTCSSTTTWASTRSSGWRSSRRCRTGCPRLPAAKPEHLGSLRTPAPDRRLPRSAAGEPGTALPRSARRFALPAATETFTCPPPVLHLWPRPGRGRGPASGGGGEDGISRWRCSSWTCSSTTTWASTRSSGWRSSRPCRTGCPRPRRSSPSIWARCGTLRQIADFLARQPTSQEPRCRVRP